MLDHDYNQKNIVKSVKNLVFQRHISVTFNASFQKFSLFIYFNIYFFLMYKENKLT